MFHVSSLYYHAIPSSLNNTDIFLGWGDIFTYFRPGGFKTKSDSVLKT